MAYKAPVLTKSANFKIDTCTCYHPCDKPTFCNCIKPADCWVNHYNSWYSPSAIAGKMTKKKKKKKPYLSFVKILYSSYILLKAGACLKKKEDMPLI